VSDERTSMLNAFKTCDEVLLQGVQGITDLITTPGLINTDFADVRMIMSNAGSALMGIGYASGDGRAVNAARTAISSPMLEASIERARDPAQREWANPTSGCSGSARPPNHPRGRAPRRQHHLRRRDRRHPRRRGAPVIAAASTATRARVAGDPCRSRTAQVAASRSPATSRSAWATTSSTFRVLR
jgi:hypothetical protein